MARSRPDAEEPSPDRTMPVSRRIRLAVAGVAAVSLLVVYLALLFAWQQYTVRARTDELSRQVLMVARSIAARDAPSASGSDTTRNRSQLIAAEASLIGARLAVTDGDGTVVLSSLRDDPMKRIDVERLTGEPDSRGIRTGVRSLGGGGRAIIVAVSVKASAEKGYVVAVQPLRELATVRRGGALIMLAAGLIALIVAWLVGAWVARRISSPLVRLERGAQAIAAGEWGHQVDEAGDREVAALARSFNQMSNRVASAYQAQRDFVGDVSHELRTPITSIQGFAEALADGTATDDESRARYAGIIRQEAGRLMELTTSLLALADLDAGRVLLESAAVDMDLLADTLEARHGKAASERSIDLVIELPSHERPRGDEARVLQIASALVSNAIKNTPDRGSVRVRSGYVTDRWELAVDDSGPGVPRAERDRIFERFVRLDSSRSTATGGSGLGLAVASRLAQLMGGGIRVLDSELGGARFVLHLPSAV